MLMPEEFEMLMKQNFNDSYLDQEEKHINADVLMCDVLRQLGYKAGIEVFENVEKKGR